MKKRKMKKARNLVVLDMILNMNKGQKMRDKRLRRSKDSKNTLWENY
jgi:hypothetical protein